MSALVVEDLVRELLNPAAYPWPATHVELIETHMSWVFLTDDRVLKVKRPVHYGFVDHRSLEARRQSCVKEIQVNRRLTSGVYLDVLPIHRSGGRIIVGGEGDPIEWGTLMRRLPADRMLDGLIAAESVPSGFGPKLGARLASFHDKAAAICSGKTVETADALSGVVTSNLAELGSFSGVLISATQVEEISRAMLALTRQERDLFEARVDAGWIRDGHGDLRTAHICLESNGTLQIFDSIEFSALLRCADVASDLAFLLMDLKRLGREDLGREVLDHYAESKFDLPQRLVSYYETHRALVRVKVHCLTVASAPVARHAGVLQEAHHLLDIAFRTSMRTGTCLIVMTGLSGTGKSTVAQRIARATGAEWIRSDVIRGSLTGDLERTGAWLGGAYGEVWTERVYRQMLDLASRHLHAGTAVLLDATFLDQRFRDDAARVAEQARVPMILVETRCPEPVVRERLASRAGRTGEPSEASYETYLRQVDRLRGQPMAVPPGSHHLQIDTSGTSPARLDTVYQELRSLHLLTSAL